MKKNIIIVIAFTMGVVISIVGYSLINQNKTTNNNYVCSKYSNEFQTVNFSNPSTSIEYFQKDGLYFFNVTLSLNDAVDFSNYSDKGSAFVSVSFDGLIPYSTVGSKQKLVKIPLENGKLPSSYTFTISSNDNAFTGKDLEVLNNFLNKKEKRIVVSVNLFDPNGIIVQVSNVFVE
ncbi:MAG: hypothetical protein WBO70_06160 [Erysipelotrichaceae bacterium]